MITVKVRGGREASRFFDDIATRMETGHDAMNQVAGEVLEVQKAWWATEGRGTWAPDEPGTLRENRAAGLSTQLMRDTGVLEAAATRRGARGQVLEIDADQLLFAIDLPYAEPLATGGRDAMQDPTDQDVERYADAYLTALITNA